MKYRVLKSGGVYYPQYKSWWTFGWRDFYWHDNPRSYFDKEYAINFCKENSDEHVVWESHPENNYCMHTGQE